MYHSYIYIYKCIIYTYNIIYKSFIFFPSLLISSRPEADHFFTWQWSVSGREPPACLPAAAPLHVSRTSASLSLSNTRAKSKSAEPFAGTPVFGSTALQRSITERTRRTRPAICKEFESVSLRFLSGQTKEINRPIHQRSAK